MLDPYEARIVLSECLALVEDETDLLTVKKAAGRLGVSPRVVYELVEKGLLQCHRVGTGRGVIRFTAEQVKAYLDRQ